METLQTTQTAPPGGAIAGMKAAWRARGLASELNKGGLAPDGSQDPGGEAGMATAEYAVGTLAAAAFAGLLLAVLKSGTVQGVLESLIMAALSVG